MKRTLRKTQNSNLGVEKTNSPTVNSSGQAKQAAKLGGLIDLAWNEYKTNFSKTYRDGEEERNRLANFVENYQFVSRHNEAYREGKRTFTTKLNKFADMTLDEYSRMANGLVVVPRTNGSTRFGGAPIAFLEPLNVVYPNSVDYREYGWVTPVKDQGQCGACWSFSATGALEAQHARKTHSLVSLSEQNLVDCSTKDHGCDGGWMPNTFEYIRENGGVDTESSYPYEARQGPCRFNPGNVGATTSGHKEITSGDEMELLKAVATEGPISVGIDARHDSFRFYNGGVYYEPECSSAAAAINHALLVVGYGTDSTTGGKYWLVKNSWGKSWGEDGYVRMARDRGNQCGIASYASFPTV